MFKKKKNPAEGLRLTFPSETESAKFQFDPGTTAAEILTALNAGESEMCVQAKDSSRRFSSSSPAPCIAAASGESPLLTQMKSDRGDEDGSYCNSLSLIAKAVCLIRFNRQHGLFRQCITTARKCISQLRKTHAFLHRAGCHCQAHDRGGLGTRVSLLR